MKATSELSFEDYLEQEAQGQRIAGLTKDHREGVNAFMQKRKPVYYRPIGGINHMTKTQEDEIEQESMKRDFYKLFINGEQVESSSGERQKFTIQLLVNYLLK